MKNNLKTELTSLLDYINENSPKHVFMPDIVNCVKEMIDCFGDEDLYNKDRLKTLATALGRLITDDYAYFNNELGAKLFSVINKIMEL